MTRWPIFGVLLAICACSPDQRAVPTPSDLNTMDRGAAAAIRRGVEAVQTDPANPDAWDQLGLIYLAHDRHALARQCLEHALSIHEARPATHYALAHTTDRLGDTASRRAAIERARQLQPDAPVVHWQAARWALDAGELDRASTLADTVQEGKRTAAGDTVVTLVRLTEGRPEDAMTMVEPLVKARPNDRYARFLLGRTLQALGRHEEATMHMDIAGEAPARFADPWLARIAMLRADLGARLDMVGAAVRQGKPAQAQQLLDQITVLYGLNREILLARSSVLAQSDRVAQALRDTQQITREHPDWAPGHVRNANVLLQLAGSRPGASDDRLVQAVASARRATELAQGSDAAWYALARAHLMSKHAAAVDAIDTCIEIAPHDGRYWAARASILAELGRSDEAMAALDDMDTRFGLSVDSLLTRARILGVSGRTDEAIAVLSRCSTLAPDHPGIESTLRIIERTAP